MQGRCLVDQRRDGSISVPLLRLSQPRGTADEVDLYRASESESGL